MRRQRPVPVPYSGSVTYRFDLAEPNLPNFLDTLRNKVQRVLPVPEGRLLKDNEVVWIEVVKKNTNKLLRLIMRVDNYYILGYSLSRERGKTHATKLWELRDDNKPVLHDSHSIKGQDLRYGSRKEMAQFNYLYVSECFDKLTNIDEILEPSEIKFRLEAFMVLFSEGARNEWVSEHLIKTMRKKKQKKVKGKGKEKTKVEYHTEDLSDSFFDYLFDNWSKMSEWSREVSKYHIDYTIFEEPANETRFKNRDITLLSGNAPTRFLTSERILKVKCLGPKDTLDERGKVVFYRVEY